MGNSSNDLSYGIVLWDEDGVALALLKGHFTSTLIDYLDWSFSSWGILVHCPGTAASSQVFCALRHESIEGVSGKKG